MLIQEPYYIRFLQQINTKFSEKQVQIIKEKLSPTQINKITNPFSTISCVILNEEQLAKTIIFMAKQMDELSYEHLNASNLQKFINTNYSDLKDLLSESTFHSTMFCLTIIRYLQQQQKNHPNFAADCQNQILFIQLEKLLLDILKQRRIFLLKQSSIRRQENQNEIHNVFLVLLIIASARYITEDIELLNSDKFVQRSSKLALELIEEVENQKQGKVLMEFMSIISHSIIFNEEVFRPIKFIQFCLGQDIELQQNFDLQFKQIDLNRLVLYFEGLSKFIRIEKGYETYLTAMLKKLISLKICNFFVLKHIDIIIEVIKQNVYPTLKVEFTFMLVEAQNQRNVLAIDQIFQSLLNIGVEVMDTEVQRLILILLKNNSTKRIEMFIKVYNTMLKDVSTVIIQKQIINFILSVRLKQTIIFDDIVDMIKKYANVIQNKQMEKIHQLIRFQPIKNYIELLEIIIKNRDKCFNVAHKDSKYPFVQKKWLEKVGGNQQVYNIYLDSLINRLCGLNQQQFWTNFNQPHIVEEFRFASTQYYQIILKQMQNEGVFNDKFYKKVVFCQALLGVGLSSSTYSYFSKYINNQISPQFLKFLRQLIKIFKNSSSLIIYLHALLQFQMSNGITQSNKHQYQLVFILKEIQESQFFRLRSYSIESAALLYELVLKVKSKNKQNKILDFFEENAYKIMKFWGGQMSKIQAKSTTYFFIYREIKKIYPFIRENKMEEPTDRLKTLWDMILSMLNQEKSSRVYYEIDQSNKVIVQCIHSKLAEKLLEIQGELLKNMQEEMGYNITIQTSSKQYIISINKTSITTTFRQKDTKAVHIILNQTQIQRINQNMKYNLQFSKNTIKLSVNSNKIQPFQLEGDLQQIIFTTSKYLILKNIKIKDKDNFDFINQITDHVHNLNEWIIKIKKLNTIQVHSFLDQFDFDHAFCLFSQMVNNSFISLTYAYKIYFKISLMMIKKLQNKGKSQKKPNIIIEIFSHLQKQLEKWKNKSQKPVLQIQGLQISQRNCQPLYYFITSSLLPKIFWHFFSNQSKIQIKQFLTKLVNHDHFKAFENTRLNFFEKLLSLLEIDAYFIDLCHHNILKHSLNNILTFKFKRYLYLASSNNQMWAGLRKLINLMTTHLNNGNYKYLNEQNHSKFIILNFQEIKKIFIFCSIQGKIAILQTLSFDLLKNNNNNQSKIQQIMKQLTQLVDPKEVNELIPWLITQLNQQLKISPSINAERVKIINYYLELMLLYYQSCLNEEKLYMQNIILESLKIIHKSLRVDTNKIKYQYFFDPIAYAKALVQIQLQIISEKQKINPILMKIEEYLFKIILNKFQKNTFLKFMINLRKMAYDKKILLLTLINHQSFRNLQPYKLSIFLQFIVQVLLIIRYKSPFSQLQNQEISLRILNFLNSMISNAQEQQDLKQVSKYLFYSFPNLQCKSYYWKQMKSQVIEKFQNIQARSYLQLKGGIYFKCVLILLKIMEIQPKNDYSYAIKYFLLHQGSTKKKLKKQARNSIQSQISNIKQFHKRYYLQSDIDFFQQGSSISIDQYIVDFFLMSFAKFLSNNSHLINERFLNKYNRLFLQGCVQPQIWKDIISSEINNNKIQSYQSILKLLQGIQVEETRPQYQNLQKTFLLIKQSHLNWAQPYCSKMHLYFSEKAKEIRIIQLIHTHFVLNKIGVKVSYFQQISQGDLNREQDLNRLYQLLLQQEQVAQSNRELTYLQQKTRKVKKIQPYTCIKKPVHKIMEYCINNMACPITSKFIAKSYEAIYTPSQKSINMDHYHESAVKRDPLQKNKEITEEIIDEDLWKQEKQTSIEDKKYCELITKQGSYFCEYQLEEKVLKLVSRADRPQNEEYWYLQLGTPAFVNKDNLQFQFHLEEADEILVRKFNNITQNSLQFFYSNGTSKFINFYIKKNLAYFISMVERTLKGVKLIKDTSKYFEQQKYTEKWMKGYLSNFDYLMLVNKFSGRTYNDLNQYYVFPWVLLNCDTDVLDLTNPDNYRDLCKPVGALNKSQLEKCKKKYEQELNSNPEACFYRSHYSTQAFVFYYLFRIQPYSSLYRNLQGQKWDDPDRLFCYISQVWESITDQKADVKQSLPEFYYLPLFLRNISNVNFGKRQNHEKVNHVHLPKWSSSPQEFIVTMRAALESDYVSENLHHWIDLIFGVHQKSPQKYNVFRPNCYSDPRIYSLIRKQKPENIKGIVAQIHYFGQCPLQLFKKEHRPKNVAILKEKKNYRSQISSTLNRTCKEYIFFQGKVINLDNDQQNFYLQIEHKQQKKWFSMPIAESVQQIKQIIQKPLFKNKPLSSQQKNTNPIINNQYQLFIGNELLLDISIKFDYKHVLTNQMWIACYGAKGIKIFNWQQQEYWSWHYEQVNQVILQPTRLIFSTPTGKLYFQSLLDKQLQEYKVFKDVCSMMILVHCLPRLPSKQKNCILYRVLCVGDNKKVIIVQHKFRQIYNFTSRQNLME